MGQRSWQGMEIKRVYADGPNDDLYMALVFQNSLNNIRVEKLLEAINSKFTLMAMKPLITSPQ